MKKQKREALLKRIDRIDRRLQRVQQAAALFDAGRAADAKAVLKRRRVKPDQAA